ncbi:PREDICTED: reticuline oxidase-like protein [Theobroma cacao]|uniref:Reticuline oxidase-like protein n=1 Tax=Theobroma cacao TaxID=3641 RepID=A0AB32WM88_THECC|nr:PREDICTED: reticuline oxidase-like protein [Theobroma cacao]
MNKSLYKSRKLSFFTPTDKKAMTMSLPLLLLVVVSITICSSVAASDSVYESFIQCLTSHSNPSDHVSNIVYSQSSSSYNSVLQAYIRNARFNTSATPKPVIIITPLQESHVSAAVICSKKIGFQLKIRSGGHDFEGISYVSDKPFFILDMFNLRSISVNMADESAWVEAGATLGELYYRIWEKGKVHGFPAGVCPTVGVGGHISGAGYGNMVRKYGLSVDHVVDAKIVDVNGKILDRKGMGEDLFWAIRGGGGGSFGVILAYKIKLVPVPETVTVFKVERTLEQNATDVVYKWQSVAPTTDNNLFMRMLVQPATLNKQKTIRISIYALYLGRADNLVSLLAKDLPELGLKKENCLEMSWIDSALWWGSLNYGTSPNALLSRNYHVKFMKRKSDYVQTPIPKDGLEWLWKRMIELAEPGLVFNPYGGIMNEIKATDTPFPHRAGNLFKIQYSISWKETGMDADRKYRTLVKRLHSYMTGFVSKNPRSAYLNYRDLDIGISETWTYQEGKVYGQSYFNGNFERLVDVKSAVDPENFFRNEQSIPPRTSKA